MKKPELATILIVITILVLFGAVIFIIANPLNTTAEVWGWWSSSGKFNAGYDKDFHIIIKSQIGFTSHELINKNWSETKSILIYYHTKYGISKIDTTYNTGWTNARIMEFDDYINAGDAEFPGRTPIQMTKAQLEPGQLPKPSPPATPLPTPTPDYSAWYNKVVTEP